MVARQYLNILHYTQVLGVRNNESKIGAAHRAL